MFAVKHVSAIPLDKDAAAKTLTAIRSLNTVDLAATAISHEPSEATPDDTVTVPNIKEELATPIAEEPRRDLGDALDNMRSTSPHVRFASEIDLRQSGRCQLQRAPSPSPSVTTSAASSGRSSPTQSPTTMSPVTKALAQRMSFWNLLPRRGAASSATTAQEPEGNTLGPESPDKVLQSEFTKPGADRPVDVDEAVAAAAAVAAAPPRTTDEQNKELEIKIVRETVRLFSKGGMYFTYSFGGCIRWWHLLRLKHATCRPHDTNSAQATTGFEQPPSHIPVERSRCARG